MTQRWIATSQNCKLRLIVRARSPRPICGKLERQSSPSLPEKCERVTGAGTPGAWVCHLRTTPNQRPLPYGSGDCLHPAQLVAEARPMLIPGTYYAPEGVSRAPRCPAVAAVRADASRARFAQNARLRSEERRVGKECRSRWS